MKTTDSWDKYQDGLHFMRKDGLQARLKRNEKFYSGNQWDGVKGKELPKPVFNMCKRIIDHKVASVLSEQIKINYEVQGFVEGHDSENEEKYELLADTLSRYSETMWETINQDTLNALGLLHSTHSGLNVVHYYWNQDIKSGNDIQAIGEIEGELISATNYFPSNPNSLDVQKNRYIIISHRLPVEEIKETAKKNGVPGHLIRLITPDNNEDDSSEKGENELGENATVLLHYYKKEGAVYFKKCTKSVEFQEETPLDMDIYPIATSNWDVRSKSCYGNDELSHIIPNQKFVNLIFAMWMISTQRTAFPKVVFDANRISGWTNAIGTAIGVKGDISNVAKYLDTGNVSYDVNKLVEFVISYTKDLAGANENALGETRPENTSALIAQQKQAAIPLDLISKRFRRYIKDVGSIWSAFWLSKYNTTRALKVKKDDGTYEIREFNGTDFKDIRLNISIDVGASTQWSEVAGVNTLMQLFTNKEITLVELLERLPNGVIPKRKQLIQARQTNDLKQSVMNELMTQFVDQLPPETRERLEEEGDNMENAVLEMMSQQMQVTT